MKVVFLGNHTVGVRVLQALIENVDVVGVVAHPHDEEDGVVYESVFAFSKNNKIPVIRATGKSPKTLEFILDLHPDLIWVTDYRYILPENVLNAAPLGAVNIHPSLLPHYRGRAAINWAIINNEKEIGLTVHYIDKGVDTGDIIKQISIHVDPTDYIGDILNKCYPIYYYITNIVIKSFKEGKVIGVQQKESEKIYPKRIADDGIIEWSKSAIEIHNLIRAVSHPYPGAFSFINGIKIYIWKANYKITNEYCHLNNGSIINYTSDVIHVKCSDGIIIITDYSVENDVEMKIKIGNSFNNF